MGISENSVFDRLAGIFSANRSQKRS